MLIQCLRGETHIGSGTVRPRHNQVRLPVSIVGGGQLRIVSARLPMPAADIKPACRIDKKYPRGHVQFLRIFFTLINIDNGNNFVSLNQKTLEKRK